MKINTVRNYAISSLIALGTSTCILSCQKNNKVYNRLNDYIESIEKTDSFEYLNTDSIAEKDMIKFMPNDTLTNFNSAKQYIERKLDSIASQQNLYSHIDNSIEIKQVRMLKDFVIKQKFKGKNELIKYIDAIIKDYESDSCHPTSYRYDGRIDDNYQNYKLQLRGYEIEGASSIRGNKLNTKIW